MRGIMSRFAHRSVVLTALVGVALAGTIAACGELPCATAKAQYADALFTSTTRTQAARAVFCLTNDERTSRGLNPFTSNTKLATAARLHAEDAVARQWWFGGANPHTNPDGKTEADRIRAAGYCPNPTSLRVAENVYWGWGTPPQTPRKAVEWWMGSTGHRANILDSGLKDLGVGVALGAPEPGIRPDARVFVQNFGSCS